MMNKRLIKSFLIGLFISSSQISVAQSDGCTGVPSLTVNSSCSTSAVSLPGSFSNGGLVSASCAGTNRDDGWFSFTATSTTTNIDLSNTDEDATLAVWSSCGGGTELACDAQSAGITNSVSLTTVVGVTYYIQIHRNSGNNSASLTGDICVYEGTPSGGGATCATATNLACGATVSGTTNGASAIAPGTGCSVSEYGTWYTFVGDGLNTTIECTATSGWDHEINVASGSCGSLTNIACEDGALTDGTESVSFNTTLGVTYYVYVAHWSSSSTTTGDFDITRTCSTPGVCTADMSINTTTYSNTGLTTCGFGDDFTSSDACGSSYMGGDDIIIAYTPTATQCVKINLTNTDTYTGVFITDGCPDDAATTCLASSTSSSGNPSISGFNVTAGTTYYITVSTFPSPQCTAFDLDIVDCPPPPANDDCSGAFSVTVNPDLNCGSTTSGTVENSTASSQSIGACGGTADDDVWFSFVATGTTHTIDILNVAGSTTDMYHSVYTGICPALTAFGSTCSDANSQVVTGLTPGQTYYIRVYTFTSTSGQTSTFDVCVGTPPPPPANDDCSSAESLTMSTDGSCDAATGSVYLATDSGISACGGTANDDVWYSFVATDDTAYINRIADFDSEVEAFDACSGASLGCQDGEGSFELTGLTVGNTYYFRIHSWSSTVPSATSAGFTVCVYGPTPPPPNVICANQEPICSDSPLTFIASSGGADADVIEPGNDYDCLSTSPNPTWYYMDIATSGNLVLDLTAGSDIDFALWGPYADLTTAKAACGTLPLPIDCSYSASATEEANIPTAVAGEVYVLLVTNYADVQQGITLESNSSSTAATSCSAVLPVNLINFFGETLEDKNVLKWQTASVLNNDYFLIERSLDGKNYESVGRVEGNGTTSVINSYSLEDKNINHAVIYYRISQFDLDGNQEILDAISISREITEVSFYPNPVEDELSINFSHLAAGEYVLKYTNTLGQTYSQVININTENGMIKTILPENLDSGLFLVTLTNEKNQTVYQSKLVKK